jgi:hypothetical protein
LIPGPIKEGKESMNEAIRNPVITSRHDGMATAPELPGEVFTRRVITVVLGLITALTFAFGFGNVWALGRALGVPAFVAPLVGPAVDLSVAGLLIGIRHLSMVGVPREQLRPARVLLTACGAATLALNIAGPVAASAYGRAAFDAVGPALLIGWAETGPGLLRHLYAVRTRQLCPVPGHGETPAAPADGAAGDTVPVRTRTAEESGAADREAGRSRVGRADRHDTIVAAAGLDDLLAQARRFDRDHRMRHSRPVSAETLRQEMQIGSARARTLVKRVRELHEPVTSAAPEPDPNRASGARKEACASRIGTSGRSQASAPAGELAAVPA